MRDADPTRTLRETIATIAVFTIGLSIVITLAEVRGGTPETIQPAVLTVIEIGTSLACYFTLRPAYVEWRRRNPNAPSASWLSAVGTTLLYGLVTSVCTGILQALVALLAAAFGI
jgi:hypothetical protein